MSFREKIINYRKESPSVSALSTKTDLFFLGKYGNSGGGGKAKFNGTFFPGCIYFFNYTTDSNLSEKIKFINRNPLFFYLSSERIDQDIIIKGIDLTITPPEQRLQIIESFVNYFSEKIKSNEIRTTKGESPDPIRVSGKEISNLFGGTGYNFSFVGFKLKFVKEVEFIDYEDWHKLPYLKYTLIQGITINEIYNNYRSKLNS
jgi:hypothetical protein